MNPHSPPISDLGKFLKLAYSILYSGLSACSVKHLALCRRSVAKSCLTLETPWTAAHQASLFFTISWSLLRRMSIESVMLSSHLMLCHPFLLLPSIFPSLRIFSDESALHSGWPKYRASASVLPVNIQGWFPLGWTGWISLLEEELSSVFPSTTT